MPTRDRNGTAWEARGPAGAPAVLLIHGLGLSRRMWRAHAPALAARYRVLSYDLYGHGESSPPPADLSLSVFATQLRDLMDALDVDRAALVGFSLGGMINRRFALDHADRVAALAIFNSPHERDPQAQRLVEDRAAQSAAGGPAATIETTLERWFTAGFRRDRPEIVAGIRRQVLANDPRHYAACRRVLARGVVELVRPDPPIAAPALVVTCENDTGSTPAMSHAIATEIAGARTIVLPGLQHMGLVERPAAFTAPLLDFLGEALG